MRIALCTGDRMEGHEGKMMDGYQSLFELEGGKGIDNNRY